MRRSQAPSFRNALAVNKSTESESIRSTSSLLNILNNSKPPSTSVTANASSPISNSTRSSDKTQLKENVLQPHSNSKIYNVLWGKKSTKKHKTWEGDGILEIVERNATLKDVSGDVLGYVTNIRPELIEEGYIMSIGSKEVQILELTSEIPVPVSMKRSQEETQIHNTQNLKKVKTKAAFPNFLTKKPSGFKRTPAFNEHSLVMPEPTAAHQWTYNYNKKFITQVVVDNFLTRVLRPHQRIGVLFLYECVMGYRQTNCFGAILADEMGLGKTLQCITLIWTLLKQGPYGGAPVAKKILIITPSSLTGNWQKEFTRWLGSTRIPTFIVDAKNKPKDYIRYPTPVIIMSYEMFVRYHKDLESITFDLLICDEGHRLKNNTIKAASLLNLLDCRRRIILSGTPIQNDLQEFYALVDFVNPGFLGSNTEYRKYYELPIIASRDPDVSDDIKTTGEEKAAELNRKTSHFILRRTQEILDKYLPLKTEVVVFCKITELQKKLYTTAVNFWENREMISVEIPHLSVITALKKICNHPCLVWKAKTTDEQYEITLTNQLCEIFSNPSAISNENSGKIKILKDLLINIRALKEKVVVVSSYTQTLDIISKLCDSHFYKYSRLDGSVPSQQRTRIVENFNRPTSDTFAFLLSAKAGGVGLNLIGASRLILFDSDWNPATDLQAMSRVWRDGQKKSVYIYRLLTAGTIEEKIYQRQISKTGLSGSVVDPNATNTIRMSDEELKDLFTLQFDIDSSTHSMLNCACSCAGEVPQATNKKESDITEERSCQLGVPKRKDTSQITRVDQLMQWEHHGAPYDKNMISELGLNNVVSDISFIFRNKCYI